MPKTCALCPTTISNRQTFCKRCFYLRELEANRQRRLKVRAENPKVAHCLECDTPVSRKGQRCEVHLKQHRLRYQQEWRKNGPPPKPEKPEKEPSSANYVTVTPEMRRACPLRVELWRTIAPATPHLDWRTL